MAITEKEPGDANQQNTTDAQGEEEKRVGDGLNTTDCQGEEEKRVGVDSILQTVRVERRRG